MSGHNVPLFLKLVSLVWTTLHVTADTEIFCLVMQSCILPCSFQGGPYVIIHWFQQVAGSPRVHSYYENMDQLEHQNQKFFGRTSLFKDQISRGNASLLLTGVKVEDQSRYRCIYSTISGRKDSFINLHVDAPVSKVSVSQVENRIICSSERIYPQPELTWSTILPSSIALENRTTVHQTEDQLYTISSSLMVLDDDPDLSYSCSVRTRRNKKKATIRRFSVTVSSRQTSLSCSDSNVSVADLLWTFNQHQIIVNQSSQSRVMVSEEWRHHVKNISESGSLHLQDLSAQQEGIYACELSNGEETNRTIIFLEMEEDGGEKILSRVLIIFAVAAAIAAIVRLFILAYRKKDNKTEGNRDLEALQQVKMEESSPSLNPELSAGVSVQECFLQQKGEFAVFSATNEEINGTRNGSVHQGFISSIQTSPVI